MSNGGIPVIKFLFKEDFRPLKEALNIQPAYEVEEIGAANDLATFLTTVPASLIITSLKDKNDLIQIATFLKVARKVARDTMFKIVVVNFSGDRNFEKAVAKLGIQDTVEIGINTKAFKFKLDFWMKSLNAQIKNNSNANAQKQIKSIDQNKTGEKKAQDSTSPVWQEPLDLEDDIWILKHDNDAKKILSKWLIRLLGPSPYIGQWTEVKSNHWRYDIKPEEKEMFAPGAGAWFFTGDQKPDFVWKENIWLITGDSFELYYKDATQVYSRLKSKDRNLTIAKNSMFAKTKEQVIVESFDKELVFKREAERLEDLEGKNKTDQIDNGHLQGKDKGSAALDGNLSGEVKPEAAINHENLTQKTSTSKESSYWNNKNSYDSDKTNDNELSAKADGPVQGSDLERARKDLEHQKYYKNHNEAQKYEAAEAKERERIQKEDKPSGPMSGKSSTDELEKNYDNSKNRGKEEQQKKERELSGKSDTDKLKSHMGQKDKLDPAASKEREAADLDGKSSTDKLASHYGGKAPSKADTPESKEKERKEKEEREAKERTDSRKADKSSPAEKERKEKEEKELKERALKAKAEEAESKTRKNAVEEKEIAATRKLNKEDKDEKATRKNETESRDQKDSKTGVQKEWEGDHDYGLKGESETEKLHAHYRSKRAEQAKKEEEESSDTYAELFGKSRERKDKPAAEKDKKTREREETAKQESSVLPFSKVKEDKSKPKTEQERELDEITRDARVISILTQNNKNVSANLDDFFDETIIFSTAEDVTASTKIHLDLAFKFLEKDTKIKMEGNVLSVEGDGEGNSYVTVQVTKENANALGTFMKLYELRQENVNQFLKKAKGL